MPTCIPQNPIINQYSNMPIPISPVFESLSVVRQNRRIPMLFGYRNWGFDKAGKLLQDSEFSVKTMQIAKYAFDTCSVHTSGINQFCLPISDAPSNISTFYCSHMLKTHTYGMGPNFTGDDLTLMLVYCTKEDFIC